MSDRIYLERVPGRLVPVLGQGGRFHGLQRARGDVPEADIAHRIPGGHSYVDGGPFPVEAREDGYPRDIYLRRAVLRGDLALAKAPASPATKPAGRGARAED